MTLPASNSSRFLQTIRPVPFSSSTYLNAPASSKCPPYQPLPNTPANHPLNNPHRHHPPKLSQCHPPPHLPPAKGLKNNYSTPILRSLLKSLHPRTPFLATSSNMLHKIRTTAKAHGWTHFEARGLYCRNLSSMETGSTTHVFTAFTICSAPEPEPERVLGEMHFALAPGGRLALAVWGPAGDRVLGGRRGGRLMLGMRRRW